jgi:hypothetical protein
MPDESNLQEQAKQALQEAYERLPTEHPWGYFHYMDGPPAAGGGVGCFAWFDTRDEMLLFIARHQVWLAPGPEGVDPIEKAAQVEKIIDDLLADNIDMDTARISINEVLKSFSQFEWWGPFEELVSGESEFAREIREWYRDFSRAKVVDSSPVIREDEEFAYALQAYGL